MSLRNFLLLLTTLFAGFNCIILPSNTLPTAPATTQAQALTLDQLNAISFSKLSSFLNSVSLDETNKSPVTIPLANLTTTTTASKWMPAPQIMTFASESAPSTSAGSVSSYQTVLRPQVSVVTQAANNISMLPMNIAVSLPDSAVQSTHLVSVMNVTGSRSGSFNSSQTEGSAEVLKNGAKGMAQMLRLVGVTQQAVTTDNNTSGVEKTVQNKVTVNGHKESVIPGEPSVVKIQEPCQNQSTTVKTQSKQGEKVIITESKQSLAQHNSHIVVNQVASLTNASAIKSSQLRTQNNLQSGRPAQAQTQLINQSSSIPKQTIKFVLGTPAAANNSTQQPVKNVNMKEEIVTSQIPIKTQAHHESTVTIQKESSFVDSAKPEPKQPEVKLEFQSHQVVVEKIGNSSKLESSLQAQPKPLILNVISAQPKHEPQVLTQPQYLYNIDFETPISGSSELLSHPVQGFYAPIALHAGTPRSLNSTHAVVSKSAVPFIATHLVLPPGMYQLQFEWAASAEGAELEIVFNHRVIGSYRARDVLVASEVLRIEACDCCEGKNLLKFVGAGVGELGIDNVRVRPTSK